MVLEARVTLDLHEVIGSVDPRLYGANLEHFGETIYGGIWTEMIRSPKFSGPDPLYFQKTAMESGLNPNHGVVIPWESVHPESDKVIFEHDHSVYYTGAQSQRITIRQDDGCPHGIRQRNLYLEAGRAYRLRMVLRGEGQPIVVRLGDEEWQIDSAGPDWSTYSTQLTPQQTESDGAIAITFQAESTLWIGVVSLMPADPQDGFRRDLIAAMQAWGPTHLRWPGGNFASSYHWQDGVGDRDLRPPYFDPAFELWEPNLVGTDEFVAFCRLVDAEPTLTVNMGDGTAKEAAAWVDYCNGTPGSEYGAQRANNGHREPYGITTWYVGNEQFGNWQAGHCDPETYAHRYLEYARAMRAVDPDLTLIAVGVPSDSYGHWNERLLEIAGPAVDLLSFHHYSISTYLMEPPPPSADQILPKLAAGHEVEKVLDATLAVTAKFSKPPVPIAFDEWNTETRGKPPLWIEDYNICDALYAASVLHACLRRCDRVKLSAIYNLVNAMGSYGVSPTTVWKTPTTLVLELLSQHRGRLSLRCSVDSPTFAVQEMHALPAFDDVPFFDAAATCNPESGRVFLSITNRSTDQRGRVSIEGVRPAATATMHLVAGDHPLAENSAERPDAVRIVTRDVPMNSPVVELPPLSFVMLEITLAGEAPCTRVSPGVPS